MSQQDIFRNETPPIPAGPDDGYGADGPHWEGETEERTSGPSSPARAVGAGGAPEHGADADPVPGLPAQFADIVEPHDIGLERIMLGELLVTNEIAEEVEGYLEAAHFHNPAHREIFRNIRSLIDSGREASVDSLAPYVESHPEVKALGGREYLVELPKYAVGLADWRTYADLLRDLFMRRRLNDLARKMLRDNHRADVGKSGLDRVESVEKDLYDLTVGERDATGTRSFANALSEMLAQAERAYQSDRNVVGLPTGFRDLDNVMGGLVETDLVVLAGRPGMGKTALATAITANIALPKRAPRPDDPKYVVQFFSLEMSASQLSLRTVSARSRIDGSRIRRGRVSREEMHEIINTAREIELARLFIDDSPALTPSQMRTRARRLKRREGSLDLIVVDYIQLMQASEEEQRRIGGRQEEVASISRSLKVLAKELNVPVLALSQLSRAVEGREDKRPILSDLRESGGIEQDADVVLFLFREEYYLRRKADDEEDERPDINAAAEGLAEVIVAKNRHGPLTSVNMNFDDKFTEFSDLAQRDTRGPPP